MKRILVTGANKGIGYAIARRILEHADDTVLFLGSRDQERGQTAARMLCQQAPHRSGRIEVVELDVGSDESVRRAASHIRRICSSRDLDGIINNAGIGYGSNDLRGVLNVNTYGIHRVCTALIPLMSDRGRIVNVTSAAGPNFVSRCSDTYRRFFTDPAVSWSDIETLMDRCLALAGDTTAFASHGLADGSPYGLSKACANTLTLHLARQHPHLIINACTPGYVATDLTVGPGYDGPPPPGMKTPDQGALAPLFLLFGTPEGSGHYYGSDSERSPLDRYRAPGSPPYRPGLTASDTMADTRVTLRPATRHDMDLVQHWDTQPHVIACNPNDPWDWDAELARQDDWCEHLIAEVDGRAIGFVQIIDPAREETHYWGDCGPNLRAIDIWIGQASDLGRGYGSQMMRLAIARCFASEDVTAILIDPLESNVRARRFYERLGFVPVETRRFGNDRCAVYRLERPS